jgi:hypothetical protein
LHVCPHRAFIALRNAELAPGVDKSLQMALQDNNVSCLAGKLFMRTRRRRLVSRKRFVAAQRCTPQLLNSRFSFFCENI